MTGWILPATLAVILGLFEIFSSVATGYVAGWGDHFVLSPEGLSWAHPGAFENDWFMEVAPQPHWFFDVITFVGATLNALSLTYAIYWGIGLAAFGVATAMLARRYAARAVWPVSLAVTVVVGISPWAVGGTGSPVIPQALPAVLSGWLIYLLIAGMLTQRRWVVLALPPIIAIVHVQQGSIALVLLAALLVAGSIRARRIDWPVALSLAVTAALVAFGLALRPVASNLQDFVRICDEIIPYHCAAHLWSTWEVISTFGLIGLTAVSGLLAPRQSRWLWLVTVGLATLGFTGGFLADLLRIPFLSTLAQGVNVYRLGAVMLPFAMWGALMPLLRRMVGWRHLALLTVWGLSWLAFLTSAALPGARRWRMLVLGLALLLPALWSMWRRRPGTNQRTGRFADPVAIGASAGAVLLLAGSMILGLIVPRSPSFEFIASPELRQWGEEVREAVPEGEVIVAPPRFEWVKLVSERAVVADCKDVPYGGEAWNEWQRRLSALGGFEQCVAPGPLLYDTLSAEELVAVADEYGSDSIIVNPALPQLILDLEELGWDHSVGLVGTAGADLMRRP